MDDRYGQRPAGRQDLDLDPLLGDLSTLSGQLDELATMWRRQCQAGNSWPDMPHAFPRGLRDAAAGSPAPCGPSPGPAPARPRTDRRASARTCRIRRAAVTAAAASSARRLPWLALR
jgi:hypothetical protein